MSRTKSQRHVAKKLLKQPRGKWVEIITENGPPWMTHCYRNNRFIVMIDNGGHLAKIHNRPHSGPVAMIQRHDDNPIPNHWAEMQRIKNEIFGEDAEAVEYYPATDVLVDVASIYWLWITKKDEHNGTFQS